MTRTSYMVHWNWPDFQNVLSYLFIYIYFIRLADAFMQNDLLYNKGTLAVHHMANNIPYDGKFIRKLD